jgi:hypothetical protein
MWYDHTNFVQDIKSSSVEKRIRGYYVGMQFTSMHRKMEIEQRKEFESRKQKRKTIAPSKKRCHLDQRKRNDGTKGTEIFQTAKTPNEERGNRGSTGGRKIRDGNGKQKTGNETGKEETGEEKGIMSRASRRRRFDHRGSIHVQAASVKTEN